MKITFTFLLLLFLSGMSAMGTVHAVSPLTLDGVGTDACLVVQPALCGHSQLLTTTKGHDVIILVVQCGRSVPCDNISSITDSSGLTFTQRLSYTSTYGSNTLWEYFAIATAPLKSDNITVLTDTCKITVYCTEGRQVEGMQVVAIHGANTRAVFDQSPSIPTTCSLPACGNCEVGFGTCSVSIETSTLDFVIAITAINDAPSCGGFPVVVPGFVNIATDDQLFEVDYAITTTSQSNVTFNCNSTDAMAIIVDAISFRGAFGISP